MLDDRLTHYPMIAPFDAFEILCIWKYHGKRAFAPLEQMLQFPYYFQKYSKLYLNFLDFFQCCLNIENDVMI